VLNVVDEGDTNDIVLDILHHYSVYVFLYLNQKPSIFSLHGVPTILAKSKNIDSSYSLDW